MQLTLTFSTDEVAILIGAITDALNANRIVVPQTDDNKKMDAELTALYNKVWKGTWSEGE